MESHYHHCPQLHPPPISASSHFSWVSHLSYNYMHLINFCRQVKKLIPVCLWLNLSWQVPDTMQPICPTHSLPCSLSCVATLSPLGGWARLAHMQEVFDISSLLKNKKRSSIWPINNYKYPLGHVLTTENDRRELSSTAEPLKFGYRRLRQLVHMHSLIHSSFPLYNNFSLLYLLETTLPVVVSSSELFSSTPGLSGSDMPMFKAFTGFKYQKQKSRVHRPTQVQQLLFHLKRLLSVLKRSSTLLFPLQLQPLASLPPKSSHLSG